MLSLLHEEGFIIPGYFVVKGKKLNDVFLKNYLTERRETTEYAIDGVVLDVDNEECRQKINPSKETLNPEYARKFKISDVNNYAETKVVDVELNVSKTGYIKPTIVFEPVELVGVTISRCTGFNMKYIYDNKIQPGCVIGITRQGDVIPMITGVVKQGSLK